MGLTFVLDASAVLRYMDNEPGADRVEEILIASKQRQDYAQMSAVHWGEVTYVLLKRSNAKLAIDNLKLLSLDVVPVSSERAERTAAIHSQYKIPYVDSFALELTGTAPDHTLITADFDFNPAAADFSIEFLPQKIKP